MNGVMPLQRLLYPEIASIDRNAETTYIQHTLVTAIRTQTHSTSP